MLGEDGKFYRLMEYSCVGAVKTVAPALNDMVIVEIATRKKRFVKEGEQIPSGWIPQQEVKSNV